MPIQFPTPTGSYEADCAAGRQVAADAVSHMVAFQNRQLLIQALNNLSDISQGHRVGFITEVVDSLAELL